MIAPTIRNDFDSYKIWCYSAFSYEALIYFYQSREYIGRIVFLKDDAVFPDTGMAPPFGTPQPSIYMPISKFNDVVTLLREEKPLYLFINADRKIGIVATSDLEPVGEEEGV